MEFKQELPILEFASAREWEAWLQEHHESAAGLWLKIAKRGSGLASITYARALESAHCFGWIDGQKGAYDERFWLQRFTPRGPRSKWSLINREKAVALSEQGRMRPAGAEQVRRAREDGRWEAAYSGQRTATVPDDLRRALAENPQAHAFFATLDGANRYAILYRLQDAKRPQTRTRRLEKFVAMLAAGEKLHP